MAHQKAARSGYPVGLDEALGSWCRISHQPSSEPQHPIRSSRLSPPAITVVTLASSDEPALFYCRLYVLIIISTPSRLYKRTADLDFNLNIFKKCSKMFHF